DHGSTFGGNPLSAAVGLAALELLEKDRLIERSAELGAYLLERLRRIESPLIRDVRGKGLWCGVDFDPDRVHARVVAERLVRAGVLTKDTHETVIRFAPPLVIEKSEIDWALEVFQQVLDELVEKHPAAILSGS
ncbi:MAG: aminotransferase class III-fold pyridoxal phosphate-dependent enzyme, partial [Xanthomonadaceae bacterium]|nr:aminotransferase class III-fold pyridoxal phosphate-dependent enzyme [Xanthomonadaceae bacterium]